jgi:MFS family permease
MHAAAGVQADRSGLTTGDYVVKGGWYTLWVMLIITLFGFVDRQLLTLAAAPISASLGLNDGQLGMVHGLAFAIFTAVAVYPIAWASDRFDRRIVMGACVATWSIGTAACGFARNFEELFLAAVAIASGEAALMTLAQSYVPDLFKGQKRLLANGLIYIFSFLGISAGLALGGSAIGALDAVHGELPASLRAFDSWRLAFFLVALPAPLLLLLLAFTKLGHSHGGPAGGNQPTETRPFWPYVVRNRAAIAGVFGGLGLYAIAFLGYFVWLPMLATRLFGTTPAENGSAMGLAVAIGMVSGTAIGTLTVRRMLPRMGPSASIRFFWVAMVLASPLLIGFHFVTTAWQLFTLFGMLTTAGTAIGCITPTLLQDMAPTELRARMFAIWGIIYGVIGGVAPAMVGWISTLLGPEPRMLVIALTLLSIPGWIAAILVFRLTERPFAAFVDRVADQDRAEAPGA